MWLLILANLLKVRLVLLVKVLLVPLVLLAVMVILKPALKSSKTPLTPTSIITSRTHLKPLLLLVPMSRRLVPLGPLQLVEDVIVSLMVGERVTLFLLALP